MIMAIVKPFQCSSCAHLQQDDVEDKVFCSFGIDPRPRRRCDGDAEQCSAVYQYIEHSWHEKFYWERQQ